MTKIPKLKILFLLSTFYFLFSVNSVFAAELFFETESKEMGVAQQFKVDLMLDTEGQNINAVEGEIVFPSDLLELGEIKDGGSIISFWIEKPSKKDDSVFFSGLIPGGFEGVLIPGKKEYQPGPILSLIFKTKKVGQGSIEIKNPKILLNDGFGTPAEISILTFQFQISQEITAEPIITIEDKESPEPFEPIISQDPLIFEGKYFLVFLTQDKGLGVDHYEVLESRKQKTENRNWEMTESPYLLKDQKLRSYIYVKAIDKVGNERIATLLPQNPLKWYENYLIWVIIILGIITIYSRGRILWKKKIVHE